MPKKKETTQQEPQEPRGERFVLNVKDAKEYPFLTLHEFDGVTYQVVSILTVTDGTVDIEFVRKP